MKYQEELLRFSQALESYELSESVELYNELNALTNEWDGVIENIISAKLHNAPMYGPATQLATVTEQFGTPVSSMASLSELKEVANMMADCKMAIESHLNDEMDAYDENAAMEADILVDAGMESTLDDIDIMWPATEGVNIDTLKLLKKHYSETRAIRKEMLAAKKDKNWALASEKAIAIARMSDQLCKDFDSLPESAGSAAIVTVVLGIVAIAAAVGAAAVAGKVGSEVAQRAGRENAKDAAKKAGKAAYDNAFKENADRARAAVKAANARPKADPKKAKSFIDKVIDGAKTMANEPARQAKISKEMQEGLSKAAKDAKVVGKQVSKDTFNRTMAGYAKTGTQIGRAAGAGTVGTTYAISSLTKVLKGKKVIDENGTPKKVPLTPNEWNSLIRWAKSHTENMKKKYLELAQTYKARASANEAFMRGMQWYNPAIESFLDEIWTPATEGVNAETLSIWRDLSKNVSKLRKEMKYAAEANNPKIAAEKAREIAAQCDQFMQALNELPQSAWAAALPKICLMIIVALVGVKVGPWVGKKAGEWIGKNMAEAATSGAARFIGKPVETVTSKAFGVAGAVMPAFYAFKQLMAGIKSSISVTKEDQVSTKNLNPNEANAVMNMAKSSIRSCKRKYLKLAEEFEDAAKKADVDKKALGNESDNWVSEEVAICLESLLYEDMGVSGSGFDRFLAGIQF